MLKPVTKILSGPLARISGMTDGTQDASVQAFLEARHAYRAARNSQRLLIVEALKSAGFEVKTRGNAGRGLPKYSSGGRLTPPFDLSNWMWVAGERDGVFVMVSLQVLDQDPRSMNMHALIDRVGVDVSGLLTLSMNQIRCLSEQPLVSSFRSTRAISLRSLHLSSRRLLRWLDQKVGTFSDRCVVGRTKDFLKESERSAPVFASKSFTTSFALVTTHASPS